MSTTPPTILIVDDEVNIHYSFRKILPEEYRITSAYTAEEGIQKLAEEHPDVVVMDVRLPGISGLEALQRMRQVDARVPIIIMTAYGTVETAITAMKHGAYEYLLKPFDVDRMRQLIDRAVQSARLMHRAVQVAPQMVEQWDALEDAIVGSSPAMQEVYKLIGQVAPQDVPVLIRGESGTGKELVARAIYHHSRRSRAPFLEINCAALPETLLESELFGHERGAFTGAHQRHIGKFEQVDGGTLFLDEIGEMSLTTQAKILRVIQQGTFTRVGGKEVIRTDVRLIVATNRNLEEMIRRGRFREDLYYRLNVITITLPPLRERTEDIPELVKYFIARYRRESGKTIQGIAPEAIEKLRRHPWPGNVRQLENCIRRAVVLTRGPTITADDLELNGEQEAFRSATREDDLAALDRILDHILHGESDLKLWPTVERMLIAKALEKTGGNQVQAAKLLGIHRNTLRNRMEKYGLSGGAFTENVKRKT
ncbi:MAG: sigma-54-dependent Fis family transcriptional regulator [Calditrichaeota bacterium]|nr:MAG: sigma-54-dependent Fis family transcriptional regulator [Calditrichota bacterium]